MIKKVISLLVLTLYLHGISGYTMSFHKCTVTGFENVYTGFGNEDPCGEEEKDCHEKSTHFEEADCCDLQQTVVNVDDDTYASVYKIPLNIPVATQTLVQSYIITTTSLTPHFYSDSYTIRPPEPCSICVFRI